jgi:hypothetical protein
MDDDVFRLAAERFTLYLSNHAALAKKYLAPGIHSAIALNIERALRAVARECAKAQYSQDRS